MTELKFDNQERKRRRMKNFKPSKRKFDHLKVITVNDIDYVLPNDAARVIGCDSRTLKRYLANGTINGEKDLFGTEALRWLVRHDSLKKYIDNILDK